MTGRLIAVVGPSGVGKDTVMAAMAEAAPALGIVRRVITRPSDAGGEDFDGVDPITFAEIRDAGAFALWWQAHDMAYGIPASVDADLGAGRDMLANLSRGVLAEACARFAGMRVLSLTAAPEVLSARLQARGREDSVQITRRLARAGSGLAPAIKAIEIDNSGPLESTVKAALSALYPVRA
jgi:ribose 1,5-bisphosphokinase